MTSLETHQAWLYIEISELHPARCRAIERKHPASAVALNSARPKALAVVHGPDVDLLVPDQIHRLKQILVDRTRAFQI